MPTAHRSRACIVEGADPLQVAFLWAKGEVPRVPLEVAALSHPGSPDPAHAHKQAMRLSWLIAWDRTGATPHAIGIASYYDHFDYHTMRDVREVVSIAGSRRGVMEILWRMRENAHEDGFPLVGSIDCENLRMNGLLRRMAKRTRYVWEG